MAEKPILLHEVLHVLPGGTPPEFMYNAYYHDAAECGVQRYTHCKMSILLTDDLAVVTDGKLFDTVRGDILFFRPEEIHCGRYMKNSLYRYVDLFVPLNFLSSSDGAVPPLMHPFLDRSPGRINRIRPEGEDKAWLLSCAEEMVRAAGEGGPDRELVIFSYFIAILSRCRKWYDDQRGRDGSRSLPASLKRALDFINGSCTEPLSLQTIADTTGCSVTYLTGTFRRYIGKSVGEYLTECRLLAAERYLLAGMSVTETCYKAGFNDTSYFIRVFRRYRHCTPGKYLLHGQQADG